MTAHSIDAFGLTYVGIFTVSRPSGDVQVLRFTLSHAATSGLALTEACGSGITTVTDADTASLGSTSFDAVSLAATVGGTPVLFTVTDPPSTPFPGEVLLQDVTLSATTLVADTLSAPSFTTHAGTC